ncbi:hypothetical protein DYI37_03260 [Fulvimarina endophytica]|uniref:Uncharacterized protein n=1 Tax=Fulvimarina endophytica TaxID=2293836 RepID=A0A371XBP8_9HYPH|nr:hypothetical protein [Fulvimarina endophytica]RFC66474.1 hypothetical protein DYI37_03260 [Fulvimarina endophytica]
MSQTQTAGNGHNSEGLTNDQAMCLALMHRRDYRRAMDAKKTADAAVRNCGKLIKADLGKHGLDQIKVMMAMESEDGAEKVQAEIKAKTQAVKWSKSADAQLGLFPEKDKNGETKAYNAGKLSGMDDEPLHNPYGAATSDHEDFARGWHAGKAVMDDLLAQRAEAAAEEEAGDELVKAGGDLDEDDAKEAA